jgi:hypothetical protein
VKISLDTRELLREMVQQAACVVSAVVDVASEACSMRKRPLFRSASCLVMPPPAAPMTHHGKKSFPLHFSFVTDHHTADHSGLDLLCTAAAELPVVVSPHLSNTPSPVVIAQDLDLGIPDDEDIVSNLSIDQCVDIIDVCLFGQTCDSIIESPLKRAKIEE